MNYFTNRNVKSGFTEEDLDAAVNSFNSFIDVAWLSKNNYHPLRELWKRQDVLAAHELFTFGWSINKIATENPKWIREQIKLAKSAEKTNYQGAFCEIIGLALLNSIDHHVTPANLNEAGYDGVIRVSETKHFNVSVKNYGMSKHEQNFQNWCIKTEELIVRLLKKHRYYPVTVVIDCPTQYPSDEKWQMLHSHLDDMFKQQKNAAEPFSAFATSVLEWIVILSPQIQSGAELHEKFNSYTLIVAAAYHKNENDNLRSKIEEACANLSKHLTTETDSFKNILFIHLSANASVKNCIEWLNAYFQEYPNKPISGVFLYQPSVVNDLAKQKTSLNHYLHFYKREGHIEGWFPESFHFTFELAVGTVSLEPAKETLIFTHPDGTLTQVTIDDRYFYQRGNHYIKMVPDRNGGFGGNIFELSPGVFTNLVIELPNQPGSALVRGKFPPSDQLLII